MPLYLGNLSVALNLAFRQVFGQSPGGPHTVQLVPVSSAVAPAQMLVQASGVTQVVQAAPAIGSLSAGLPVVEYSTLGSPAVVQAGYEVNPPLSGAAQSTLPGKESSNAWWH